MQDEENKESPRDAEPPDEARRTRLTDGREVSADELAALVYDDLRRIAASYFRSEGSGRTLQPTALVHEAYLRLADQDEAGWKNRGHFLSVAARMMRRVLIDAARSRRADKRGGTAERVTLLTGIEGESTSPIDLLDLEQALERLARKKQRYVDVVELRFFGGLTVDEAAEVLGVSPRQVAKDWSMARSYLEMFLEEGGETAE